MRKLALCYPWASPFMFTDFAERALNMERPADCESRWFRGIGWCAAKQHNDAFQKAMDWGADLICMMGADQVHPYGMLPRLVRRIDGGCDAIASLVPTREQFNGNPAFQRMAWRGQPPVLIDPEEGELQKVDFIGTGVLMFQADLLAKVKRPWLYEKLTDDQFSRKGDCDVNFVWRLQSEAGAQVWVDTEIPVLHASVFQIGPNFVEDIRVAGTPEG